MANSDHVDKLIAALEQTGFLKVVKSEEAKTQIRLLCRVSSKKQWCDLLEKLLDGKQGWTEHVCQQYFLKDKKLVYGWNVIINAEDPAAAAKSICRQMTVMMTMDEGGIDSIPMRGALRTTGGVFNPAAPGERRGGASQRGAYPVGGK